MAQIYWTAAALVVFAIVCQNTEGRTIVKRETSAIDPHQQELSHDIFRDKRKVDDHKWGVKNAILGFVFNKINSFIDQKTAWVDQLDKQNIAKNRAHGIEPPKDPVVSLSGIISGAIGQKLQAAAPFITLVTNKLTSGSSSGHHAGFDFGSLLGGLGGGIGATGGAHVGVSAGASTGYAA